MSDEFDFNDMDKFADSIKELRRQQIVTVLTDWAEKEVEFSFNANGTHLFSIKELTFSYAKRFVSLSWSIERMLEENNVVAAAILARSLIETIGIGCLFSSDLNKLIEQRDKARFDARMMRYIAGWKDGEVKPVNVMDGLRYLAKLDKRYVEHLLAEHPGILKILRKFVSADLDEKLIKKLKEGISPITHYDFLSEVTHPNGVGTQILFPDKSNEHLFDDELRERCKSCSLTAIWQGHYLISALEQTEGFDERYRSTFMNDST